jgi:hypothetical protein
MEKQNIGISYGIMSDPLFEQLDKQGFKYDTKKIEQFQSEIDAVHTLRFGSGLLTDSMVDKMLPKLHKKIVAHVATKNKFKVKK